MIYCPTLVTHSSFQMKTLMCVSRVLKCNSAFTKYISRVMWWIQFAFLLLFRNLAEEYRARKGHKKSYINVLNNVLASRCGFCMYFPAQKFSIKSFFSKYDQIRSFLNEKLHFLCSVYYSWSKAIALFRKCSRCSRYSKIFKVS